MIKNIAKYLIIALFFFMVGFFRSYHLPDIKLWSINQIELLTRKHGPVRVLVSDISFQAFPIGLHLNNVRIYPKEDLSETLEPIFLKSFQISLNPLSFFTGLFQFSRVELVEPYIRIKSLDPLLETSPSNSEPIEMSQILKKVLSLPLNNLSIRNMDFYMPLSSKAPSLQLKSFSIDFENQKNAVLISIYTPHLWAHDPKISDHPAVAQVGTRILVFDDQILLSALKIQKGMSYVLASGYLNSNLNNITLDNYQLKVKTSLDLKDLKHELSPFLKGIDIPDIQGQAQGLLTLTKKSQAPWTSDFKYKADNLSIDQFYIGSTTGSLSYLNNQLLIDEVKVHNNSGGVLLSNSKIQLKPDLKFDTQLNLQNINLYLFLKNLGLGEVPVEATISGQLPCSGDFSKARFVSCAGGLQIEGLRVYNETQDIVGLEKAKASGTVEISKEAIQISSQLEVGSDSKGQVDGSVSFTKGFHFKYSSDNLDFSYINLANLGLLGTAKISGQTQGDSQAATFNLDIKSTDFEISNYFLGDIISKVSYKSGNLNIQNIEGLLRATKYSGNIALNLNQSQIKGHIQAPYIELSDLNLAFKKIVELPVEFYGGGEAQVQFSGPLDFPHMSYTLTSQFVEGSLADELFDHLTFNVTSKKGYVTIDDMTLKKGPGVLIGKGFAKSDGTSETSWDGQKFRLHTFNNLSKLQIPVEGDLDFNLSLKGPILAPDSLLTAKIYNTSISQEKVRDSNASLSFTKQFVRGKAELFGKQVFSEFQIPFSENGFFSLDITTDKLDFSPLFHLVSSRSRASEYTTRLTGNLKVQSNQDYFWKASGSAQIEDLQVTRGIRRMALESPTTILIENGRLNFKNLFLKGDNTSLTLQSIYSQNNPIGIDFQGKMDIGFFAFFTPFFEDIRGTASLASQLYINPDSWSLLGSSFITDGHIRSEFIPHSFDSLNSDLLFNGDKILINKLEAQFAGGDISAHGQIEIKGPENIPVKIEGQFNRVDLSIPADVNTRGAGNLNISGNWFPYTLGGTYIISQGEIVKDFSDSATSSSSYTRSQLLPKSLKKEIQEVVLLDIDAIFSKGLDLRNDIIESKIYGKLKIKGPPTDSTLLGQIQLQQNGKIYFKDVEFEIETGDLKFSDPSKINPDLHISSKTTVTETLETTTQRYDITMLIQGKAENPIIHLSSIPPRSEKDIISLLALGITTESYQSQSDQNNLTQQSYEVGASLLTKNKFGRDLKKRTGLEFKVSSALDQSNNSTVPKVTISRQWSPRVGTSASRTFGESTTNDVKVEYQLNKNVSVIGSWEGREISNTSLNTTTTAPEKKTTDILGLDIEYKVEFK